MATRLLRLRSSRFNAGFLFLLTLLPLTRLQETPQYEHVSQREKVYEDFVEIIQSPTYASGEFNVRLDYRCRTTRIISLEVISYGHEDIEKTEFRYNFAVPIETEKTEKTETRVVLVKLRDSLVFRDNKVLGLITDLHTVRLKVVVSILDLETLALAGQNIQKAEVFAMDHKEILVTPSWSRPVIPMYCFSCFVNYLERADEMKINKCLPVNDVAHFVNFPVAVTGKEDGFKKTLSPLNWIDVHLNEAQRNAAPRFTITTWVYVTEPCTKNLCSILHHRNKNFLTPLVAIVTSGQFYIQLQYKDNSGHAFMTRGGIRRNTWNQIIMVFSERNVTVILRYGHNLENEEQFVHYDFPKGLYHFNDSEGYWVIGGTGGFAAFKGFIGPTTLYRRRALRASEVPIPPKDHLMFGLEHYFSHCSAVMESLVLKIEEIAIDRRIEENLELYNDSCQARSRKYTDLYSSYGNSDSSGPICDVPLTGETPEADKIVLKIMANDSNNIQRAGEQIFDIASQLMYRNVNDAPLALSLYQISGCASHPKSLYSAAIMYVTGLGVPQDVDKAWQFLLVGAMLDYPLSQISLGYRFLIGGDGMKKECDISAGYYKMAAVTTDKVLLEHHAVHTHSEAVRLDDYDELANHKGKDSDTFQWLARQALQGIGDAQGILGEMYFYGKKGFQRDLGEAIKFYQMGADMGKPEGLFNLGVSKLRGQGTAKNETEGIELIRKAAEKGFPSALNAIGFIELNYRNNHSGAATYFKRAADKGDRDGLYNMGVAYDNGWKTEKGMVSNKTKAVEYWLKAAGKGHPAACVTVGEELRSGENTDKNCDMGVVFLRFLAEQHPEVGWLLRRGLQAYYRGELYKSLVSFILAGEAGMEVPQYNAALLCEDNEQDLAGSTAIDCVWRYYKSSADLGWVYSMMKVGDGHWYGNGGPRDLTSAAKMYANAANKNEHPHALYNLAYMVEYNYSLAGIRWANVDKNSVQKGNLTFAGILYQRCRDSKSNKNESFFPCAYGLVRVSIKEYYEKHPIQVHLMAFFATSLVTFFSICLVKFGDRMN